MCVRTRVCICVCACARAWLCVRVFVVMGRGQRGVLGAVGWAGLWYGNAVGVVLPVGADMQEGSARVLTEAPGVSAHVRAWHARQCTCARKFGQVTPSNSPAMVRIGKGKSTVFAPLH